MREQSGLLEGKTVMVTGASSGLGLEFCLDLANAGCNIVTAARRIDRLRSLCDRINQLRSSSGAVQAVAVEFDVSGGGNSIEASVERAWGAFGRIDALTNNAGVRGTVKSSLDISEEEWNNTIKTNLRGTWMVSKHVGIRMREGKIGGSIINIGSIAGLERGQTPGGIAYSASKAAMNTITKVMALELGPYGIRVNAINPGLFPSEITQGLMKKDWLSTVIRKALPLRDTGSVDPALISVVRYLIHDSSEYITGNIYIVDAGATLPGVPIFSCL